MGEGVIRFKRVADWDDATNTPNERFRSNS